jgi:primosomal protein N'
LAERSEFNYPPFCRLINIEIHSEMYDEATATADALAHSISFSGVELLGPQPTHQEGYGRGHARLIILKVERGAPLADIKKQLLAIASRLRRQHPKATITFNVDPQ